MPETDPKAKHPERAVAEQHRRRFGIPVPVIVTILGAVLSILVGPALSRQWEDRREARELKVALAQEIGAATATTIGRALASSLVPAERADTGADKWLLASLRLQAQIRAYFSDSLKKSWDRFDVSVTKFMEIAAELARWDYDLARRWTTASGVNSYYRQRLDRVIDEIPNCRCWAIRPALKGLLPAGREGQQQGGLPTREDLLRDLLP